jgi:GT2 family glycosyltransferase
MIDLVFITYNRLEYTKLALASVLAEPTEEFSLTIWDNASTDGTVEYLKNEVNDKRIADIVFSKENVGQVTAVNEVWGRSEADLLGKLDNDCLVTPGWTRILAQAHKDIPELGVVACWHFFPEDFDYERARHKIQTFGKHQILRHPWTGGTGLLIKKDIFERVGPIQGTVTTQYWLKIALTGYLNGFYYPLIYLEHMDDPRSPNTLLKSDDDLKRYLPLTVKNFGVSSLDEWLQWLRNDAVRAQAANINPKYYIGWRAKLRRIRRKVRQIVWQSNLKSNLC